MPVTVRLMLAALCMLAGAKAANAQTAFYRAPASEVAGAPGTLVRQELIDGAPLGATTYRVLYRSTGLDNKPILVSGVVVVPPGDPPPGGRPIVAWAHPTSGVVPRCAPSLAIFLFEQIQDCVRSCATATWSRQPTIPAWARRGRILIWSGPAKPVR
jgi:hypothetical protein